MKRRKSSPATIHDRCLYRPAVEAKRSAGAARTLAARVRALEARAQEIPEDRILAAAALVLRERVIQMDELGFTFSLARQAGADGARIARHHADIEHMVAEAVRRGIALGRGDA
jgi:hypothetical protein